MVQVTEAIFSQGVLKPVEELQLREQQRVRLIIEPVDPDQDSDRATALNRLRAGIASMSFTSSGRRPTRDELHDPLDTNILISCCDRRDTDSQ